RSPTLRALRERIAGQLTAALPGHYRGDDLVFVADTRGDDPFDGVRLQVRGPHGRRDLGAQSGGMRAVFVVALFDLLDPGGGIIGLDEPETHLHPTSQRNVARLLARGPSQKIVATHAPDVIGEFEPDEIVVVRADDVVQPRRDFLDDDDKLLLHMWVRDRLEPLTAEHVVVVEGITDRVLLEHCADVTGRNLDTYGVVVLEAGGCREMPAWRRVFGEHGFQVPLTQLVDADAAAAIAREYGVRVADLPGRHVWVSHPDLEGEYVRALGADAVFDALAKGGFSRGELESMRRKRVDGELDEAEVARFCRIRANKTRAVLAVMPAIDAAAARRIASVQRLLDDVVRRAGGRPARVGLDDTMRHVM
ncbi:ATP-dependent endonuclease, OLD family protein, partial [Bifidobacterium italicum]